MACAFGIGGAASAMTGAGLVELLSLAFFPFSSYPAFFLLATFLGCVDNKVDTMDGTLAPHYIEAAPIAVYPFLLATAFAMDGSEAYVD